MLKNLPVNAEDTGDVGLTPQLRRSPGEGNYNPFQYFCLGNPMDRGVIGLQRVGHNLVTKQQQQHKLYKGRFKNGP